MAVTDQERLFLAHAIFGLARAFEDQIGKDENISSRALSVQDVRLLIVISHHAPIAAHRLAALMGLTPGTTSIYVQRLVEKGFIRREQSREDRRIWWLSLTEEGKGLFVEITGITIAGAHAFLSPLTADEEEQFYAMLAKISRQAASLTNSLHGKECHF